MCQTYQWWKRNVDRFLKDRNQAIGWAKNLLYTDNWVILDNETTGLSEAEIVQIDVVDREGKIVLNSLTKPTITIPNEAIALHSIIHVSVRTWILVNF